jgi:hypothetical protein
MDEFTLLIDENKFRRTNGPWNDLCLNDPWSVGYVSTLIEAETFQTKEDWENYYYDSGQHRIQKLNGLSEEEKTLLNDHTLKKTNPLQIDRLDWNLKNLNFQFGRTREQLMQKGQVLQKYVSEKGIDISIEECVECVRYRTICETWNGIIIRERNTIVKLKSSFPNLEFAKTDGSFDHQYAVDYELSEEGNIFCGIQIKPKTYTYNMPYIVKARNANARKNQEYLDRFHRPVFDVISQTSGEIVNVDVIEKIKTTKK